VADKKRRSEVGIKNAIQWFITDDDGFNVGPDDSSGLCISDHDGESNISNQLGLPLPFIVRISGIIHCGH